MDETRRFGRFYREKELKKLIRNICILSIIFMFICGGIQTFFNEYRQQSIEDSSKEILKDRLAQVNEIFYNVKLIVSQSEYNTYLKNFLKETSDKSQLKDSELYNNIMKELMSIEKDTPAISIAWMADFDGSFFIENNGYISDDNWDIETRSWYQKHNKTKEAYVTNPYRIASDGSRVISVIKPLYDEQNNYLGVFAVDVDYNYLISCLSTVDLKKQGKMMLISGDGTVIYSSDKKDFLKSAKDIIDAETTNTGRIWTTVVELNVPQWKMLISMPKLYLENNYEKKFRYFELSAAFLALIIYMMCVMIFVGKYFTAIRTQQISDMDEMTGIYNVRGMTSAIEELLEETDHTSYYYAAFAVKKINILNEMLGFAKVNRLFVHIAKCLISETQKEEYYGRISGNKFGIYFSAENAEEAKKRLEKLNDKILEFRISENDELTFQLIMGVFEVGDEKDFEKIKSYTDFTLEIAKNNSSYESSIIFFNNDFKEIHAYEQQLENDMEKAIENDEFEIYIQGKYDVKSLELRAGEVLVRWNNGKNGLIYPTVFIPLFEKNGFIIKLDYLVFEKTCELIRKWIDTGIEPLALAVNLSRIHLDHLDVVDKFYECIKKYKIPPELLQIELTESALAENLGNLIELIKLFKEKNISVAIDDFGSGYSTLSTLKELNFDTLKIDREFFIDMHDNTRGKAIVRNIISMANELNIETVSEGIETEEQLEFLKKNNGDLVQGFYFSKPVPIDIFEKLMDEERSNCFTCKDS